MPKRTKYTVGSFLLRVKRSVSGRGLFAGETIPKGACVLEYTGRPVSEAEQYSDHGKYFFWVSKSKMIDGNIRSNRARFINHSCKPNCEADGPSGRIFIIALCKINEGEELTFDYGKEYFDKHIKQKGCRCGRC